MMKQLENHTSRLILIEVKLDSFLKFCFALSSCLCLHWSLLSFLILLFLLSVHINYDIFFFFVLLMLSIASLNFPITQCNLSILVPTTMTGVFPIGELLVEQVNHLIFLFEAMKHSICTVIA